MMVTFTHLIAPTAFLIQTTTQHPSQGPFQRGRRIKELHHDLEPLSLSNISK